MVIFPRWFDKLAVRLLVSCLTGVLFACAPDTSDRASTFSIDTLASGAVRVRNSASGLWGDDARARWRVVEELRIGQVDADGPELFSQVGSVLVDELDRIWVVDAISRELRIFAADGRFVRAVGRPGAGPGEFRRIGPVSLGPDGNIWVEDLSLRRWEVFDTTGERIGGHPVVTSVGGAPRRWTRDGRLVIVDQGGDVADLPLFVVYRRKSSSGDGAAEVLVLEDTFALPELQFPESIVLDAPDIRYSYELPVPFAPLPGWIFTEDGELWVADGTGRYEIVHQSLRGDAQLVLTRDYEPIPIPDSARVRAVDELLEEFGGEGVTSRRVAVLGRVPKQYPPFDAFFAATDGTLWVRRTLGDGIVGFDVFDADGRYLGQPEVPADLGKMRIERITSSAIHAVATDEMGVEYVVRLAIRRR